MNTIFSHYPQSKRFDYANFSIPSTPKNYFLPSFRPSHQKKSFYFITDILRQVCPLILQNYFSFHLKRTNFRRTTICSFVNFLWMKNTPFILQRTFLPKCRYLLKNFFDKRWHPHNCKISIIIFICPSHL